MYLEELFHFHFPKLSDVFQEMKGEGMTCMHVNIPVNINIKPTVCTDTLTDTISFFHNISKIS